jgi:membrane protein
MDEGKTRVAGRLTAPGRRWNEIWRHDRTRALIEIGMRIGRHNISILAAGVAFFVFVAIPSGLTAIISIYGLAFNPEQVERQVLALSGILPADVIDILSNFLSMLAAEGQSALSARLLLGLGIGLWSAQAAASSMITALNAVYEKEETRSLFRFELSALLLALNSIVFALLSLLLFAVAPIVLDWVPLATRTRAIVGLIRWPALAVIVALAIAGIYRFAPSRGGMERRWGAWGVALTTIVWIGSSYLFALYVENIASYDVRYGSLGAVIVLLLWIYMAVFVVLLGAELNAAVERWSAAGPDPS